jgi:signal peptidase II
MQAGALLLSAILLIVLDQSVKVLVLARLRERRVMFFGVMTIHRVLHEQAYGGVFRSGAVLGTLWIAEVGVLIAVVQFGPFFQGIVAPVALGAALGGAGSNLCDHLWRRGVVDFIDLKFWPVFNLADVAIVIGTVIGMLHM